MHFFLNLYINIDFCFINDMRSLRDEVLSDQWQGDKASLALLETGNWIVLLFFVLFFEEAECCAWYEMDSTIFKATAALQVVEKVVPEWNTVKGILIVNALPPVHEMYIAWIVMLGN